MGLKYWDEFRRIWTDHVPPAGQAATVEGELIRAIEKLCDEAMRNGNINWDAGHERLLTFVRGKLLDGAAFPNHVVEQTSRVIDLISDPRRPCLDEHLYDELLDRAVERLHHYGSQPHAHDPLLHR